MGKCCVLLRYGLNSYILERGASASNGMNRNQSAVCCELYSIVQTSLHPIIKFCTQITLVTQCFKISVMFFWKGSRVAITRAYITLNLSNAPVARG
jgi:hypothetical protein